MEGPRIVQQCNGKAENTIAKAMHRDARQCNGMVQNGTESQRNGVAQQCLT